jgi:type II secretory pathway pseudopilin PulG
VLPIRVLVRKRLRQEAGFGLIELLMAMTVLNIGILTLVAAFNSGSVALRRSSAIGTATVLADKQIELYRALTYDALALDPSSIPGGAPYTTDAAYSATQATTTCTTPLPDQCNASRVVDATTTPASPDRKKYRVDTYIVDDHPASTAAGQPANGRVVRKVTVVVRDGRDLNRVLARESTSFDCSTALPYAPGCPTT